MDIKNLDAKEIFIPRDLSWLAFNNRVLQEAEDPANPLLERIKFLAIFVNNLDEFHMVRIAGLKRLIDSGYNRKDNFGVIPQELYPQIKSAVQETTQNLYSAYVKIKAELEENKIFVKKYLELNPEQRKFANRYFDTNIFPIITPMAIDQGHPFPVLSSKTIAFAIKLLRGEKSCTALITIPKVIPRTLRLPSDKNEHSFILIEEIIREHLKDFFKGYEISANTLFRVIRDSELTVDEEYTPDLLKAIENEIKKRPKAKVVRLEMENDSNPQLQEVICQEMDFAREEISFIEKEMDLSFIFEISAQTNKPQLNYPAFTPGKIEYENILEKVKENDFIIHLPYQSFTPTLELLQQAAKDPQVLGIKMTLYRTNDDSGIIKALKEATKNKKQVTILVEIKARFDEEKNINWAKELEEAGCHVIYGLPGMKTHSKMTLIVRKEERIRRYVHLSTGNYNEKTSGVYTDIGYFTANDDFARDISDLFNVITGYSLASRWKRIVTSPDDMREYFIELIDREIQLHKNYKNGLIFIKMNSLEDTKIIEKLYAASCAGVKIRIIVRGICCLIPGIPELSENIKVKSIVGRFLEHSRIYIFNNNADPQFFLSSADWMSRNFDRRIELLFEIHKQDIKEQLRFIMDTYWKDTAKSRILNQDRKYSRTPLTEGKFNAQEALIKHYTA
jgi:polyphosphate kinase